MSMKIGFGAQKIKYFNMFLTCISLKFPIKKMSVMPSDAPFYIRLLVFL